MSYGYIHSLGIYLYRLYAGGKTAEPCLSEGERCRGASPLCPHGTGTGTGYHYPLGICTYVGTRRYPGTGTKLWRENIVVHLSVADLEHFDVNPDSSFFILIYIPGTAETKLLRYRYLRVKNKYLVIASASDRFLEEFNQI